jgi:hypothetical protein
MFGESYTLICGNKQYLYIGAHYDYVVGIRNDIPPGLDDDATYMITLARQKYRSEKRAAHRKAFRGRLAED